MSGVLRFRRDQSGATAAEFAMVIPVVVLMTIGVINAGIMFWGYAGMHYAAQDAARCRSVKTGVCSDAATTAAYAATKYNGPVVPTFALTTAGCGNTVTATASYNFATGIATIPVNLSATACYPLQP